MRCQYCKKKVNNLQWFGVRYNNGIAFEFCTECVFRKIKIQTFSKYWSDKNE